MITRPKLLSWRLLPWLLSGFVLIGGAVTTLFLWKNAQRQEQVTLDILFRAESERAIANIAQKLNTYQVVMRGVQGFFQASEQVHYDEFFRYVSALAVPENLGGVQAVAFVKALRQENVQRYLQEINTELPLAYRIHPASERTIVAPIVFIEPLAGNNVAALGFDIFTNPVAREAAELARDSGQIFITEPLSLVQDTSLKETPSFVMYLPVYEVGAPLDTVDQRREALVGWIDVPFRMTDFMAYLEQEINPYIDIEILDLDAQPERHLLFHSDAITHDQRRRDGELQTEKTIDVGSREWTLRLSNTPEFKIHATLPPRAALIGLSGSALSLAFALLVFIIAKGWDKSERKAARLGHLYHALSEINQAIVRMETERELLPLVCRMAVDYGGMKMAWVGIVDEASGNILPVASHGEGTDYLKDLAISAQGDLPEGAGPTGKAIREDRAVISNDYLAETATAPWHEEARRYGWKSAAAFPVQRNGKPFAVLNVYHAKVGAFDEDAINLLEEMSGDISFALDNFDRDIQRLEFERALRDSESRLSVILENVGACIYLKDREGRYTFVNQQVLDLWGIDKIADVIGYTDDKFFDATTVATVIENDRRVLEHGEIVAKEEIDRVKATGVTKTFWSVKIPLRRSDGSIYALCGISTDISDKKANEEQIHYLSNYDSLTGLPNRTLLHEKTRRALAAAKAGDTSVSLLCIDLDRFKIINESLGHSVGDLVLKTLSQRLAGELHLDSTLSRMGGDEFFLLLPGVDGEQAGAIAEHLLNLIARPFDIDGRRLAMTASIGIAVFPGHGRSFEQLTQSADAALAQAKQNGRNSVQLFTEIMRTQADETLFVENELRQALKENQLVLHYQPQVDMETGKIIGVEALVRWQHPEMGVISPLTFIPVAEESGLIIDIGNWVMDTAARQQAAWRAQGLPELSVAVNLSVVQLYKDNFCDTVATILRTHRLSHAMLDLELTERIAMEHSSRTITTLGRLQAMGVSLSIDDFGTGYSSLSYLKRYPVHKLKIDKSFVDGLPADAEDQAIVIAIIGIARGLGFKTVAEGVETKEQWDFLRAHGCDAYQGYYFSKPVEADAITELLHNH
jgi:diguanylate cyclase (GGDEF)-like protein/PAS domain S-box-containing protein